MTVTKELISALLDRYGEYLPAVYIEQLATELEAVRKVAAAVAKVKAEEEAMLSRHQSERGEMMARMGVARKGCPHPLKTRPGRHPNRPICDICGQELDS